MDELISQVEELHSSGDCEAAMQLALRASKRKISDVRLLSRLAEFFRLQKKYAHAKSLLYRAMEIDPADFTVHEALLQVLLDNSDFKEAADVCNALVSANPKHIVAKDVLGIAYLQMGELDKALRCTDELIQMEPTNFHHHFKKAVLLQQKGEVSAAMQSFIRVMDMQPDETTAVEAADAISLLDAQQIRQILGIATYDVVFRTKLKLNLDDAVRERGFVLSSNGASALSQVNFGAFSSYGIFCHYN